METPPTEKRKRGRPVGSKKVVALVPMKVVKPKKKANPDSEIHRAMRRLGIATKGMGPGAPEIFKAAILTVVQGKMEEIGRMLQLITQPAPQLGVQWTTNIPSPPAAVHHQLTPEQADALIKAKAPKEPGQVCQHDGQPAVYVTRRGVPLCIAHKAQGIQDDQSEVLASTLRNKAFGGEVIQIPADVIQNALSRGGHEE